MSNPILSSFEKTGVDSYYEEISPEDPSKMMVGHHWTNRRESDGKRYVDRLADRGLIKLIMGLVVCQIVKENFIPMRELRRR